MSEMLGNQYFMARKYERAARVLEKVYEKSPGNKPIRSKLIICYTQMGQTENAWNVFVDLVREDPEFIMKMDPIRDDCPCPELVFELESNVVRKPQSLDYYLTSGMLWLFCDVNKSVRYFKDALLADPVNSNIKYILEILSQYVQT